MVTKITIGRKVLDALSQMPTGGTKEEVKEAIGARKLDVPRRELQRLEKDKKVDFDKESEIYKISPAGEKFEALKLQYEAKMRQLVYQRLVETLKGRLWPKEIATVIRAEVEKRVSGILYHSENWPQRFKEYYQKEVGAGVKSGLDSQFERRVEESAEARARKRLSELVNAVWPLWFDENIEPRIAELERKVNENAFQLLRGPWTFTCDRCGTKFDDELTSFGIEGLLRKGQSQIECINPLCQDRSWFSSHRHRFQVSLHDLIKTYAES